jgi:homocysteine S-methyltransferase
MVAFRSAKGRTGRRPTGGKMTMPESLRDRLNGQTPILLDGATGTELARRGINVNVPEWSAAALVTAPDLVRQVHADYIAAGAELITANTVRTHARNLSRAGLASRAAELTALAVTLARKAAVDRAWVLGSQAPLEDCYSPHLVPPAAELQREHREMARHLADAGVDGILVETQNTIREAVAAARAAAETGLPVLVSFVCGRDGRLLSGERLSAAAATVLPLEPVMLLVNCLPVDAAPQVLSELVAAAGSRPVGVYANIGYADERGQWVNTDNIDPHVYARHAADWLRQGVRLVGGCCGTTPRHISALDEVRREFSGMIC